MGEQRYPSLAGSTRRRRSRPRLRVGPGFTLIELLVVIAIIGILAAMLFPVFARARESARKTQCLANVKNIAMAAQIYLTDYDRFWPKEHNQDARDFALGYCSCSASPCASMADCKGTAANPYLRSPVILDEYTKSREIWKCPSSRFTQSFSINWGYGTGAWLQYLKDCVDAGGALNMCATYPPGWGGAVTDSWVQGRTAGANDGAFVQGIATPWTLTDMSTSQMSDATKQVVVADAGVITEQLDRTSWVAYPDTCRIDLTACPDRGCGADWANCSSSRTCGAELGDPRWSNDPAFRKQHAGSRHLGGSNLGFADGHAKWWSSEAVLFGGENWSGWAVTPTELYGLGVCIAPGGYAK